MIYEAKLYGSPTQIKVSKDSNYVMVCCYNESVRIFKIGQKKPVFIKPKLSKISKISNCDISYNNKYFAFSAQFKVSIIDIERNEIIKEIKFTEDERMATNSFSFFNTQNKIIIPNGKNLLIYDITADTYEEIYIHEEAGHTDKVTINDVDEIIAYKSRNEAINDRLLLIDLNTQRKKEILVPYTREYIQLYDSVLQFINGNRIVVGRKGVGFSYYNSLTGNEEKTITWEEIGFRSLFNFNYTRISKCGLYLLIHKEDSKNKNISDWVIETKDRQAVIYDVEKKSIIYSLNPGFTLAEFDFKQNLIAYLHKEYRPSVTTLIVDKIY